MSAIESGKANPTLETLERIGRTFGLIVGFIVVRPLSPALAPAVRPDTHGVASPSPGGERW